MKTIKPRRKTSKNTLENIHGLAELISWQWLYYQMQSADSI
jgi:hypothetical protein